MPAWPWALAAGGLLLWWALTRLTGEEAPPRERAEAPPRYLAQGVRWQRFDPEGRLEWRASAESARGFADDRLSFDRLRLERLGDADVWHLESPAGEAPPPGDRLRLDAPVTAVARRAGQPPVQLDAGEVWVERRSRSLTSDEPVMLRDGLRSATALGFDAAWDASQVRLRGNVEVRLDSIR